MAERLSVPGLAPSLTATEESTPAGLEIKRLRPGSLAELRLLEMTEREEREEEAAYERRIMGGGW